MDNAIRLQVAAAALVALAVLSLLQWSFTAAALLCAGLTALHASTRRHDFALAALPTLLAAIPLPPPAAALPAMGPVRIEGTTIARRNDLVNGDAVLCVQTRGGAVEIRTEATAPPLPGDRILAFARIVPSPIPGEPPTVRASAAAVRVLESRPSLRRSLHALRHRLEAALLQLAPQEHAPLLLALTLGGGARLDADLAAAHRSTGCTHLLAVSGAHAAMLAWMIGLQPFARRRPRLVSARRLGACGLMLVAYGAITGMQAPVFRAVVSCVLAATAEASCRRLCAWRALSWSALGSCLLMPHETLTYGFGLSYAAVIGLTLSRPGPQRSRLGEWILTPLGASCWATLLTAPLSLLWFGQLAPWTILLTPLLAPCIGALLFLGLLGAMLALVRADWALCLQWPIRALADAYSGIVLAADDLPFTPIFALGKPGWLLLAAALGLGLLAWHRLRGRRGIAALCGCLCVPFLLPATPSVCGLSLWAVGHGQACLLTLDDGAQALVDCGSQDRPGLAARKAADGSPGRRLSWLIVTHDDADHHNAVRMLLARVQVQVAVLPEAMRTGPVAQALRRTGAEVQTVPPGTMLRLRHDLAVAAPGPAHATDNDGSLWTFARLGSHEAALCWRAAGSAAAASSCCRITAAAPNSARSCWRPLPPSSA